MFEKEGQMTKVAENEPTLLLRMIAAALSDQYREQSSPKIVRDCRRESARALSRIGLSFQKNPEAVARFIDNLLDIAPDDPNFVALKNMVGPRK